MPVPNQISFDGEVTPHAPDLYDYAAVAETIDGFDAVTEADIARYHEQGFIAVRNAFTPAEVQSGLDGLAELIAGRVPEFQNIQFTADVRDRLDQLSFEERMDAVRRLLYFVDYETRTKAIANHPKLLALTSRLMDAPSRMFQDMALIKPPNGREKPWHQDHAYFELTPETKVVGVWIALDPADVENGCMRVMPGWHRRGKYPHFQIRDLQICDSAMEGLQAERVAVPLEPGGCLIFDSHLPHGTPSNFTSARRRALQFHYQPEDAQRITAEERVAIWGGEANGLSC
ncbi:MAG TPA: phytanoyl-CoA dioxygenase family protein [Blastocatellia bacterium]|nr:phytanoyl-CoA dioxygenase family protein [Blastocatellia bacterium]HMY71889.1 phytanoyl-CoA dioxygenase family protein [Blastocatellia bacterium]HMZ21555.1 phytanoyl-CoA dioxygenase family protein [Blastocatellia bacterium]HNG32003.1 phytanoyl-CoA dioxygenase family protein [Blastocatellia bacterium]